MNPTLAMFLIFVAVTLLITYWASGRTKTTHAFYSADRQITGFQNGLAVAGDYMSAASFLGIAGLIAFYGFDGFMYSVGWLVAYLTVLLLVAEPLRNTGKYTMADVLSFRMQGNAVRGVAALSTLIISVFYMIAQMIGAGSLVNALLPWNFDAVIVLVGVLMLVYVTVGGMLATTWVQIIKATLLIGATGVLSILVMLHFNFSITEFFNAIANVHGTIKDSAGHVAATKSFTQPGLLYNGRWGALNLISLGVALIFGTAGLPHILMRFYTVPSALAARRSVVWAMILIGAFYIMTTFLGFGAATLVGKEHIGVRVKDVAAIKYIVKHPSQAKELNAELRTNGYIVPVKNNNLAALYLSQELGGNLFLALISAVAFATILAVVAGLTIAASSAFAHDIWFNIIKQGRQNEREHVRVARITAVCIGAISILLAIALKSLNVAFLVGLAFAVAASANVPAIVLTLNWKRFNRAGTLYGMLVGLISSLLLIAIGPAVMGVDAPDVAVKHFIQRPPLFPLENPGIVSVPLGFIAAILATLFSRDPEAEARYPELHVRANTGIGAET